MEKPAFLHVGILLCLVLGINFMAEARSLISKHTKTEIQDEVEPVVIFIENGHHENGHHENGHHENGQHEKTHKLEKHIAKIDKKLKKMYTLYKQQRKDIESLSDILTTLITKNYIKKDEVQIFAEKMQVNIQEIESNLETLEKGNFQSEEIEESKSDENNPEEVESSLGMFDSDQDDAASLHPGSNVMIFPFWFNTEEKSKSIDSVDIGDFENDHQSAMPEFQTEIDNNEMHKNTYNWLFSSEEEE